ncbi:MAG: Rpn family recombination-promoting nuclease/putative transposase [Candidatus Aminicenantes bacterium]|nr:Rpn family recombination-promoting nuclease/putative transposase [Candidatus Aminicenantes bacterium]
MDEIFKINDKIIKRIMQKPDNAKTFLEKILPEKLKKRIDFSSLEIGPTNYVSQEFKEFFADIIIKTKIISKDGVKLLTDICFIFEHKTEAHRKIFIQFLKYMVQEWQKDIDKNIPLRIIVPIVFYHGKKPWKVSPSFAGQFDIDDDIKEYLLNFKYILFDTATWDFREETDEQLKNNVFLLSAMALMKYAYNDDHETIEGIFNFWREKGFTGDIENVIFFLTYISETKDLSQKQLKELLIKTKLEGGEIMETLAQRLRAEGKRMGIEEGLRQGLKEGLKEGIEEGEKKGKLETAKRMLNSGLTVKDIVTFTGLSEKEVRTFIN